MFMHVYRLFTFPVLGRIRYSFRMRRIITMVWVAISLAAVEGISAKEMPRINGETLSGKTVEFPLVTAGSVAILFFGFSHASHSQLKAWTEHANKQFHSDPHVAIYSIAVLEDAPRFVRGMAVHSIKNATPVAEYDHFAVVYQRESELKHITVFSRPEEAYILVLDPNGEIRWVGHGRATDSQIDELIKHVDAIVPK